MIMYLQFSNTVLACHDYVWSHKSIIIIALNTMTLMNVYPLCGLGKFYVLDTLVLTVSGKALIIVIIITGYHPASSQTHCIEGLHNKTVRYGYIEEYECRVANNCLGHLSMVINNDSDPNSVLIDKREYNYSDIASGEKRFWMMINQNTLAQVEYIKCTYSYHYENRSHTPITEIAVANIKKNITYPMEGCKNQKNACENCISSKTEPTLNPTISITTLCNTAMKQAGILSHLTILLVLVVILLMSPSL